MENQVQQDVAISIKNVDKSYGKHKVLSEVNLEIHKGDIFGLVGKNGSGKTTLFKLILGLSSYQHGTISINGNNKKLDDERAKIGFFITPNFFVDQNAVSNLKYHARLKGITDKNEISRVLKLVGLDGVKSKYSAFSLGMKQRLGLANALLGNPEILILDEPTNGLDPQGISDIRNLVKKLNEEYGMTIIISSHILGELQNTADKFGIIHEGRVARVITQDDLKNQDRIIRLEVDDVEKAKQTLQDAGINVLNATRESLSLEDVYFSLVNGNKDKEATDEQQ